MAAMRSGAKALKLDSAPLIDQFSHKQAYPLTNFYEEPEPTGQEVVDGIVDGRKLD
jgi:hypothetical protein